METISRDFTIDLRRLRVLRELEQRGTVAATAEALHLTPSAVSQQLAGLSREVGVQLLEKSGRGVRLTGQARVLLSHAALVQEQLERARADLAAWQDGTIGEVRVAGMSTAISAVVAPAMIELRETRPGIDIRVLEDEPPDVFTRLDSGDIDIAIAADYRDAPSRQDPRYHRVDLITDVMDVVVPQGHPHANPSGVRLEDLSGEVWAGSGFDNPCAQIMVSVCATAGFSPDVRHSSGDWDAIAALVAAGAGIALIPRLAQPLRAQGLVVCPVIGSVASRLLFAVVRAGSQHDSSTAAVLATLQKVAARRPDAAVLTARGAVRDEE
jgi:DNA-binding transcriptional LysR family regulator